MSEFVTADQNITVKLKNTKEPALGRRALFVRKERGDKVPGMKPALIRKTMNNTTLFCC